MPKLALQPTGVSKGQGIRWAMTVMGIALSILLLAGCQLQGAQTQWGEEQKLVASAWAYVDRAYVDPNFNGQNWWSVRQKILAQPLPDRQSTYTAIRSMVETLEDPFTRFLDRDQYSRLQTSTAGELSGVGLQIAIDENQNVIIIAPIEGTPATTAHLQAGDQILEIDSFPLDGLTLDQIAERMRGPTGSRVVLTIKRNDAVFQVDLSRAPIAINPVRAKQIADPETGQMVAYIRLNQFNGNAAQEVKEAIEAANNSSASGLVLDLRNNPGGLLQAAIEIGQFLISQGDIVVVTTRNGVQDSIATTPDSLTLVPLVVLVNEGSASASEVLAGALQDSGRGILVGSKTFGKGLIQSLFELEDGSGLAVTTAKYMTPKGRDINQLGIVPDVEIPLPTDTVLRVDTLGTEADPQFVAALSILRSTSTQAQT